MLRAQIKQGTADEQQLIEQAKSVYGIDFENVDKHIKVQEQQKLQEERALLVRKMQIIEDSKASIDNKYAAKHRANRKKMQQLEAIKA